MRSILIAAILISMISCGGGGSTGAVAKLDGYDTSKIGNSNVTVATKKNSGNELVEKGYLANGKRNGMWLTYYTGDYAGVIKSITSYSDGMLNGPYVELSNRGQIDKEVNYAMNEYNGRYVEYKFGRIVKEANYKGNLLDGASKDYFQNGKIQKEINYKGGKQHGLMRYYNEEGKVTVEYQYENGNKISGGMVEGE